MCGAHIHNGGIMVPAAHWRTWELHFDSVTLLSHALAHKDLTPIVLANALALLVVLV